MNSPAADRYSRQIRFSPLGEGGQQRLQQAAVAIVGCGALGSFQAGALARAGVGRLRLIDRDFVELNNLQRQWLFDEADAAAAAPKSVAAARKLALINSSVAVEPIVADLAPSNIEDLLDGIQLILDGTDNFETRFLLNDYAVARAVPWIYGAAVGSYGLVMPVIPGDTACLRCLYPEGPTGIQPTCETAGVLNTITSTIASLQCSAALRWLTGHGVVAQITRVDVWTGFVRATPLPARQSDCPCCAQRRFEHLDNHRRAPISLCGQNAVQIHERQRPIDLAALAQQLLPLGQVRQNEFALRFITPPHELTVFPDGRAIIKGTTDPGLARSLYARYIGR